MTLVSLGAEARDLLALVSISLAALLGFVFPLISAVFDFGKLAHHASLCSTPMAPGHGGGCRIETKMSA